MAQRSHGGAENATDAWLVLAGQQHAVSVTAGLYHSLVLVESPVWQPVQPISAELTAGGYLSCVLMITSCSSKYVLAGIRCQLRVWDTR